ncbi:Phosphoglycolate phosphatase [bioreactor metagenome]|uniref:Phosphoglycolate phosphatase n=1 Tax=bioreactor metagenome TaxID=1076179 RepID=A0A645BHC6_9ZZZZ|nr:HAD family hydrolase [Oscillospiraceae bacterium]
MYQIDIFSVKVVIFDLDGTIAYTLPDLRTAINETLRSFGLPERSLSEVLSAINFGGRRFVESCLPADMRDAEFVDRAYRHYLGVYARCHNDQTSAYNGIPELCRGLNAKGYKLAVFTNKENSFANNIINKLIPDTFDIVLGYNVKNKSGIIIPHKPEPEGAVYICHRLGATPDSAVFIGDSAVDMNTAVNAGMHKIWVSWGYALRNAFPDIVPDFIADKPAEIAELFGIGNNAPKNNRKEAI